MSKDISGAIVPAILAGAAAYFGIKGKGGSLGDLAKDAICRVINDQTPAPMQTTGTPKATHRRPSRNKKYNSKKLKHEATNN